MSQTDVAIPKYGRVLLVLLGLSLGWLAVRGAADGLLEAHRPALAAAFWPPSGAALANLAQARIVAAGGTVDATARALTIAALHRSPASATPLILGALAASERGDMAKAEALMTTARTRDPRNAIACYWLLDHYIRTGRYADGMAQVAPAIRLRDGAAAPVFALVAGMVALPDARVAVRAELATDPPWRNAFFQSQATLAADPALLLALLRSLPPARDPVDARSEQQAVLYAMVNRAAYAPAYAAWRAFLPPALRPVPGAVYDPDFAGRPGAPPFNWSLQPGGNALVAIGQGGLSVTYSGTEAALLAEQYLVVAPAAYRLSVVARRTSDQPTGDGLLARLVCAQDASLLATLPLDALPSRMTTYATAVTIPPGCDAVRVQIAAEPSAPGAPAQATLSAVRLSRI